MFHVTKLSHWLLLFACFLLVTLALYFPALHGQFIELDDALLVRDNSLVHAINPQTLRGIFTTYDPELYIPVTLLTYQIEYQLAGLDPLLYHIDNVLLHAFNALLVTAFFWLFCKNCQTEQRRSLALLGGILFLVHPLMSGTVAWISTRKDLLATAFFLLSTLTYIRYRRENTPSNYILSLALFFLGLLSKVVIITLPFTLLLIDYVEHRRLTKHMLIDKIPYAILSGLFAWVALLGKVSLIHKAPLSTLLLMAPKTIVFALGKFFLPIHLSIVHPYLEPITLRSPAFFLPLVFVIGSLGCLGFLFYKNKRLAASAYFFFLLTLSPTFGNAFTRGIAYVGSERYIYLPSIGLIALVLIVLHQLSERKIGQKNILLVSGILLIVLSAMTYKRAFAWRDTRSLFHSAEALSPDFYLPYSAQGIQYAREERWDEAIQEYEKSIALYPNDPDVHSNLGAAYGAKERHDEEIREYQRAIALDPLFAIAHFNLAIAYGDIGEREKARRELRTTLRLDPTNTKAKTLLREIE